MDDNSCGVLHLKDKSLHWCSFLFRFFFLIILQPNHNFIESSIFVFVVLLSWSITALEGSCICKLQVVTCLRVPSDSFRVQRFKACRSREKAWMTCCTEQHKFANSDQMRYDFNFEANNLFSAFYISQMMF